MSNIIDTAQEYLKAKLSVIPTQADKIPAISAWKKYQSEIIKEKELVALFSGPNVKGLAIICGAISGDLEVLDVDTKYDLTGSLWEEVIGLIKDNLPELYNSLVIAQTKSGGYHIYYRCSSIGGNVKLASRETTQEEKEETYKKNLLLGHTEEKSKQFASKDTRRVLIETRGEGGYVVAPTTPGYTYIQGVPKNIPTITPEEREILFGIAKSFNEIEELEPIVSNYSTPYRATELSPFDDYNKRGDIVSLLQSNGWRVVNQRGERINLLRPGQTDSKTSGNFHTGLRVLRVFSTSTEFNPDKGYSPGQVFSLLECVGDYKLAYRRLLELGYGEPYNGEPKRPTLVKTQSIKVESVNRVNKETSVISNPGDSLKIENIRAALGEEILITSPGPEAQEEILRAIDLLRETEKRIYIKEGGGEYRDYKYLLRAVFKKYGEIQDRSGGLSDRDKDSLLDEIVIASLKLQPLDKDIFLKDFLSQEAIKELGISEESLSITVDRLTTNRDRENQQEALKKLLSTVTELQNKGEVGEALELLEANIKKIKLEARAAEYSKLLLPITEEQVKAEEAAQPDGINSGFKINEEDLILPGGAISVFAAPTNHGKTLMLINTILNALQKNPGKKYILFTYEERANQILQYFLNAYMEIDLNKSKKTNRRLLRDYFKTGATTFISQENHDAFLRKKDAFFKEYIETGRILISYVNYSSTELTGAIEYLHKAGGLGGIFIDYFQLLRLPQESYRNYSSRQEELKQICIALKDVAVSTGLPLVLAAQFNREVTNLMRLHATNIGEAGDIERIVNTLIGIWNLEKEPVLKGITNQETDEIKKKVGEEKEGIWIEILKSRDLPTGAGELLDFNGNTGKIKNQKTGFLFE